MTAPKPILVLTAGGTIDKVYFDALSEFQVGDSVVEASLRAARVTQPYRVQEVCRKDSLEMDDADRIAIRSAVAVASETRIIISHGTDTMVDTAKALSGCEGKTILLTGALTPARFGDSDAPFNLGMAFAAVQLGDPGIYIAMNGTVFRAGCVRKDRTRNAFVTFEQ